MPKTRRRCQALDDRASAGFHRFSVWRGSWHEFLDRHRSGGSFHTSLPQAGAFVHPIHSTMVAWAILAEESNNMERLHGEASGGGPAGGGQGTHTGYALPISPRSSRGATRCKPGAKADPVRYSAGGRSVHHSMDSGSLGLEQTRSIWKPKTGPERDRRARMRWTSVDS
jgi:hypothetical protein